MEHRWGQRVAVDFPVRVSAIRFSVRDGRLSDLSVSGALVTAELDARVLSRVQIALVLPLWLKHESPIVEGYVARKHRNEFGIEWCEFAPRAVSELLRAVTMRPYTLIRRPPVAASQTVSRLSAPLLKHGT